MNGSLADLAHRIRLTVIQQSKRANVGHIGSALSIADLVAVCSTQVGSGAGGPERDRLILSKGHASLALYAAMYLGGQLSQEQLDTYCADDTLLGVHPEADLPGVDFSTGSLGHGLSWGAGSALAARLQNADWRSFVLMSDAECNEGSAWEAVMFAAHHQLSNLVAVVDVNGQQALGYTSDVLSLSPLEERWRAFGWDVHVVPGHDVARIDAELTALDTKTPGPPHAILAQTEFGHGVSFMRGKIEWHYLPMSEEQYAQALAELESGRAGA